MLTTMTKAHAIEQIAISARRAFEAKPPIPIGSGDHYDHFATFPVGCCGDTCLLVAELYRERGHRVTLAYGERAGSRSHVWLLVDGFIVDLTADQFVGERQPPIVVASASAWHRKWRPSEGMQAITDNDDPWRTWLGGALAELRRRVAV